MNGGLREFDVLVAGGGLVGAAFVAGLAATAPGATLRIGVIERQAPTGRHQEERFDPRVVAITEATRQWLEKAGLWTAAVAARACPYRHMEVRDGEGTGLIEFDCRDVHQPDLGHIVENASLVAAARERLAGQVGVTFLYHAVTRLVADDDGAVLTLDDGSRVTAPLLVAADGANSFVREHSGFRVRAWDYGHSAVIATIRTERGNAATAYQWFMASGPLAFLPLRTPEGDDHYSSIVWSQDHSVAEQLMAADEAQFLVRLGRASEHRLGAVVEVGQRFCLPLRQAHAVDYVRPGVALIGDAAHSIHPLAGQGVNLGFADAAGLVEEIVRGLQRGLPVGEHSTLLRYQRRRKPDNLAMMAAMEGFKRLFAADNPMLRILRNQGMSRLNHLAPLKNRLIRQAMGF